MIRIETKTLKFWEQSYERFDLAEIAFKYNVSLKATRKAIFEGLAQSYVVDSINEYFKNKNKLKMEAPKEYEIKTMSDIANIVTEENVEFFIVDFIRVVRVIAKAKEIVKGETGSYPTSPITDGFTWIDDKKHDYILTSKSTKE